MRQEEILSVVFQLGGFSVARAIYGLSAVLERRGLKVSGSDLDDRLVTLGCPTLNPPEVMQSPYFNIVGQGFDFDFSSRRDQQLDRLGIETANECPTWDEWMGEFIKEPAFVMASVVNSDYYVWQNTNNPETYRSAGKSYTHLSLKPNGLSYPHNGMILDISRNPGRREFREGYFEETAAFMWLGEPFWKLTGADKTKVENVSWLRISHPLPSVLKLQAAEHCFTTAEGESGELQKKLRTLLFPLSQEQASL